MSYKTVTTVLGSAVATSGTFTVSYPTDKAGWTIRDAGFYRNSIGHSMVTERGDKYYAPNDFTLTFGTSSITVTWGGSTTLPAGVRVYITLNERGDDQKRQDGGVHAVLKGARRVAPLQDIEINLGAPDVADADGFFASQDLTTAGVASVSTTVAAAIAAAALAGIADVPRNVVAAWTGAAVLTVTGKDEFGNTMVESSASGTSFTGKKAFKQVTGIAVSANVTSLTVGTGDVLGLPCFVPAVANIVHEMKNGTILARYNGNTVFLTGHILEAAVDAATGFNMVSPVAGVLKKVWLVAQAGITTGGTATLEIATVAVNGLGVVVANSSSEGDVDSDEPTQDHATTAIAAGDRIEIQFPTPFNAASDFHVVVEIEPTVGCHGTFVAADVNEPTATTGDVRGTYDPKTACDGSAEFRLWVRLADPAYLGLDQYAG
jgi:hypothetical protein